MSSRHSSCLECCIKLFQGILFQGDECQEAHIRGKKPSIEGWSYWAVILIILNPESAAEEHWEVIFGHRNLVKQGLKVVLKDLLHYGPSLLYNLLVKNCIYCVRVF